jgi:hypothetical protein
MVKHVLARHLDHGMHLKGPGTRLRKTLHGAIVGHFPIAWYNVGPKIAKLVYNSNKYDL